METACNPFLYVQEQRFLLALAPASLSDLGKISSLATTSLAFSRWSSASMWARVFVGLECPIDSCAVSILPVFEGWKGACGGFKSRQKRA
jgi:hypothetical protein